MARDDWFRNELWNDVDADLVALDAAVGREREFPGHRASTDLALAWAVIEHGVTARFDQALAIANTFGSDRSIVFPTGW